MAIGAALGVIGSLASGLLGTSANASLNSATRNWQAEMYREDREYNTPANQVKRLREAGINPQLAMSNGMLGAGSSTMPSAPSTHPYDFSPISQGISNSVSLYQQKRLQDAEIDYKNQQSENLRLQNITQLYRDIETLQNLQKSGKLTDEQTKFVQAEINEKWINVQSLAERNEAEISKIFSEKALVDAQTGLVNAQAEQARIINMFTPEQQKIITSNLSKEGKRILAAANKDDREAAVAIAERALKLAQEKGVKLNNKQISDLSEYVVDEAFYKSEEQRYKAANERKKYRVGSKPAAFAPALGNLRYRSFRPRSKGGVR